MRARRGGHVRARGRVRPACSDHGGERLMCGIVGVLRREPAEQRPAEEMRDRTVSPDYWLERWA